MRQPLRNQLASFEKLEPGLFAMWGLAAWAQIQLTPGVSTLAAPRSKKQRKRSPQRKTPQLNWYIIVSSAALT